MHAYPKHKYHPVEQSVIVHSAEAEEKLGEGWHDSPAHFGVESCPGVDPDPAIAAKKAAPKAEEKPSKKSKEKSEASA